MVAHTTVMLVDAAGSHAIQNFVADVELLSWNTVVMCTVVMCPVDTLQEAMQKIR